MYQKLTLLNYDIFQSVFKNTNFVKKENPYFCNIMYYIIANNYIIYTLKINEKAGANHTNFCVL